MRTMLTIIAFAFMLQLLASCVASERAHTQMGVAQLEARQAQTLNPDAGGTEPMEVIDGVYAEHSMKSYRDQGKGEEKQTDPESFIFFKDGSFKTMDN